MYIVDFGLADKYVDEEGVVLKEKNSQGTFKGTISYASPNAHEFKVNISNLQDLSRRDDMWSYFFMLLEMLGEQMPWRKDEVLSIVSLSLFQN